MNIIIGDILVDLLLDRPSADQTIQLLLHVVICVINHILNDEIGRGIRPVRNRKLPAIDHLSIDIINHAPGIIDLAFSK